MVDLVTQAPEVQQSLVDPRAGMHRGSEDSTFSALSGVARTFSTYLAGKKDQKPDLSDFLYNLTDPEQVKEFTGLPEADGQDVSDLNRVGNAAIKMDKVTQQSSPYRLGTAKRVALTRAYIAANPKFAPEIIEAFRLSQGQGLGQAIEGLEKEQAEEAEKYRKDIVDTAASIGILPTLYSFEEMQVAVAKHRRLMTESQESTAELAIYSNDRQKNNWVIEHKFATETLPGLVHAAISRYNRALIDYDPSHPNPDQRETILGNIANEVSAFEENMFKAGMTDFASVQSMREVLAKVNAATIDYVNGKSRLESIQNGTNLLIAAADNRLVNNKYMPEVFALGQRLGDSGISVFIDKFRKLGIDIAAANAIGAALNAVIENPEERVDINQLYKDAGVQPGSEQEKITVQAAMDLIKKIGRAGGPEEVGQARNALASYIKMVGDRGYDGKLFDTILDSIADNPESVNLFTEEQPGLMIAFSNYMSDMHKSLQRDIPRDLSGTVVVGKERMQSGQIFDVDVLIKEYNNDLVDMTITPDGAVVFSPKRIKIPEAPQDNTRQALANMLAADLNKKYSKRMKKLALALHNMSGIPMEQTAAMVLQGVNVFEARVLPPEQVVAE